MAYRVLLLEPARDALVDLAAKDQKAARELALILLSMKHQPKPEGSRELRPTLLEAVPGERVWSRPDWTITYKIDPHEQTVRVAWIEKR